MQMYRLNEQTCIGKHLVTLDSGDHGLLFAKQHNKQVSIEDDLHPLHLKESLGNVGEYFVSPSNKLMLQHKYLVMVLELSYDMS